MCILNDIEIVHCITIRYRQHETMYSEFDQYIDSLVTHDHAQRRGISGQEMTPPFYCVYVHS